MSLGSMNGTVGDLPYSTMLVGEACQNIKDALLLTYTCNFLIRGTTSFGLEKRHIPGFGWKQGFLIICFSRNF